MLDPFPQIVEPLGAEGGTTFLNQNLRPFHVNPLAPYEQRWQFGFQQELAGGFWADIPTWATGAPASRSCET